MVEVRRLLGTFVSFATPSFEGVPSGFEVPDLPSTIGAADSRLINYIIFTIIVARNIVAYCFVAYCFVLFGACLLARPCYCEQD